MNKRQKRFVSIVCILLAVLMALSVILMALPAGAISETELEALQRRRSVLAEEMERQSAVIEALAGSQALIIDRKAALDRQIQLNQEDISLLETEMAYYDDLLRDKEEELSVARTAEERQSAAMRDRIRAMEESGEYSYLEFVFAAVSLSDLLSRLGDVSDIMHYDRELEQALRDARLRVEELLAEYDEARLLQDQVRAELAGKQDQLAVQLRAASDLIGQLDRMGEEARLEYAAIEAAEAQAAEEERLALEQLAREQEAARLAAQQAAAYAAYSASVSTGTGSSGGSGSSYAGTYESTYGSNVNVDGSGFIWPVDSKYITSRYGERSAPTAGASSNHPAIDIGAAAGSPIYAVADGQVAVATYNNGLGNYVSIAHDGDTATRYSHMTNFIVQPGEYVTQGQIIGYVGQTGIATGDHLDFAVIENGQAVDPLQYYDTSGMTFDPTA